MTATARRILVLGLGNPDRGDDGVGAEVIQRLAGRLPADVATLARSGDLLSLVLEWAGFDAVICIDAATPVTSPGFIHRLDLSTAALPRDMNPASSHALGLNEAVALSRALCQLPEKFIVYAVEGKTFTAGEAMSPQVTAAVRNVADAVSAEVECLRRSDQTMAATKPQDL